MKKAILVILLVCTVSTSATADPFTNPADINNDGVVDFKDLAILAGNWMWEIPGPQGMVFVDIPGGTFERGDHSGNGDQDAQPVHTVTISPFKISKYETTNAQYAEYLNSAKADGLITITNGVVHGLIDGISHEYVHTSSSKSISQITFSDDQFSVRNRNGLSMANHPVVAITWYGAKAFCDYYGYRLPTEAEWECAERGGSYTPYFIYPWDGDSLDFSKLNCCFQNPLGISYPPTTPVDYYPAYGYGLCGMAGNVSEWCSDWWDPRYYESSPQQDPQGPADGTKRSVRGGCWGCDALQCRTASRAPRSPDWFCPYGANGFRPAYGAQGNSEAVTMTETTQ